MRANESLVFVVLGALALDGACGDGKTSSGAAGAGAAGAGFAGDGGGAGSAGSGAAVGGAAGALGAAGAGGGAGAAGGAGGGAVMPACASLPNPVYVMSGDTQVPILKTLGKALRHDASPMTLVWKGTGSCTIIDAVYNGTTFKQNLSYIPDDPAWDPSSGPVPSCTPPAGGAPVQLGVPIVFPASCTSTAAPADVEAFKGPVQSFVFVVPTASTSQALSAEEAYLVFGFGATGGITPWTDPSFYFVRTATKGTQVSLGAIIGVPAARWKGNALDQSTALAAMVAASTAPARTIGILGTEIYDSATNRAALRALSFQAFGQTGGYFPDTTVTAFDKRNVRDGHYAGWSHVFYLAHVDEQAKPRDPNVARLIDVLTGAVGATAPPGVEPLSLVAGKGLVPLCAMTVARDAEGGPLVSDEPSDPCGCAYENAVGKAPAACVACSEAAPCAAAGTTCHHGFCEAADGRTSLGDCNAPAQGASLPNVACTGRTVAPPRPLPQKVTDNGGTLPPLP